MSERRLLSGDWNTIAAVISNAASRITPASNPIRMSLSSSDLQDLAHMFATAAAQNDVSILLRLMNDEARTRADDEHG